ncbi:fibrinogen-related protein, partial [Salmonella sp. s51944]
MEELTDLFEAIENEDEPCPTNTTSYKDCYDILLSGTNISGIYDITPTGSYKFEVYCDMETDGGGWTVFQRRENGSQDFDQTWDEYKYGFGSLSCEFWLGNEKLYYLSNQRNYQLRIDLEDFENTT